MISFRSRKNGASAIEWTQFGLAPNRKHAVAIGGFKPRGEIIVKYVLALVCCLLTLGYAATASSKGFYIVLDHGSEPHVSADGNVVVSKVSILDFQGTVYRWTLSPSGVTTETLPLPFTLIGGINSNGALVAGSDLSGPFRWTSAGGFQGLGIAEGLAADVSSDGTVVVGQIGPAGFDHEAFRWSETFGLERLGFLGKDSRSTANAVAGDQTYIVVGNSVGPPGTPGEPRFVRAFRWTPAVGMRRLLASTGPTEPSQALGISSDGRVIVGQVGSEAFLWYDGVLGRRLGSLPGDTDSQALDASSDGSRVIGVSRNGNVQTAFLWTPEKRMRSLNKVLIGREGLDLLGVSLSSASSISDDGLVMAGVADHPIGNTNLSYKVTWIADLREGPTGDAYQCYDVKASKGSKGSKRSKRSKGPAKSKAHTVSLSDQFGDTVQIAAKGKQLCAPVEVDGIEVADPEGHLLCYDLKRPPRAARSSKSEPIAEPIRIQVNDEFSKGHPLVVNHPERPKRLCVPSTQEAVGERTAPVDPRELELDHFLCYDAKSLRKRKLEPIEVSLVDHFETSERKLKKKPRLFCNPVDKDGEGILNPTSHLTCYNIESRSGEPRPHDLKQNVWVSNSFEDEQRFTVKKPKTVCVPSLVKIIEP
jgi:uncharacterized membrane protein